MEDTDEPARGVRHAMERDAPTPTLAQAFRSFYEPRDFDSARAKTVAALRHQYGSYLVGSADGGSRATAGRQAGDEASLLWAKIVEIRKEG